MPIRNDKPLSLYETCQPSGGAHGSDARATNATNIKRRATTAKSRINRRPPEAKRRPKITASRPNRADLFGTKNPRPIKNPGNKPTRITARSRNTINVTPGPNHLRPIKNAIY